MRMKVFFLVLFAAILIFGCSKKDAPMAAQYEWSQEAAAYNSDPFSPIAFAPGTPVLAYDDSVRFEGAGFSSGFRDMSNLYGRMTSGSDDRITSGDSLSADLSNTERKLVKSAEVRIRADNLEAADVSVTGLLRKYDAYAASTIIQENANYYSLRVPSPVYDTFLTEMIGIGRLTHRSENTEDVTLRYYDLEGRLETKKELLRTYQSYLGRASNIEEILKVEAQISNLQYDIDGTGIQLRNLANSVDYATIQLAIFGPATASSNQGVTFGERIKNLFGSFGAFLSMIGLILIGIVIYCVPIFILAVFFFWLLFGRVGLLKKLWILVMGKKQEN